MFSVVTVLAGLILLLRGYVVADTLLGLRRMKQLGEGVGYQPRQEVTDGAACPDGALVLVDLVCTATHEANDQADCRGAEQQGHRGLAAEDGELDHPGEQ